jgi:diguanylate cyclase
VIGEPSAWLVAAAASLAAAGAARARARRSTAERALWIRLAVVSASTASACAVTAALVGAGAPGPVLALPGAVAAAVAYPFVYGGLLSWNRTGGRLADPHESLNGLSAVLAVTAAAEILLPAARPDAPWWWVHATAFSVAAAFVLVGTAASVNLIADTGRDPRSWLLVAVFAPPGLVAVPTALAGSPPSWVVVAPLVAALALGCAAWRRPGALVPQPTDPIASTVGGYAVLLVSAGLLVAAALLDEPAAVTWLAAVAACVAGTRLLINTRDLALLETAREEARTDELTGLPNRRAVLARLDHRRSGDGPRVFALVDLDRFKEVNDGLGHAAGDELLRTVATRLSGALRPGELLGRLGGDEFAVVGLVEAGETVAGRARALGEAVLAQLAEPVDLAGFLVHVQASVGVALDPGDGPDRTPGRLVREADAAMYQAKRAHAGLVVFDEAVDADTGDRLALAEQLRAALTGAELVLHYQPQVEVVGGATAGVEALVRWQHPTRGLLAPADFLAVAEGHGLMPALTDVVLATAVDQLARWWADGLRLRMSVNLSASALLDAGLPDRVAGLLAAGALPARSLVLEVTETTLITDSERSLAVLGRLSRFGVGVSLDDFGTGWSSLTYLRQIPATELKLDRSFTSELVTDPRVAAIVASTVGMAHDLGLRVVAEGVEDTATLERLAAMGCDESQGYLHGRPVPAEELAGRLRGCDRVPQHPVAVLSP